MNSRVVLRTRIVSVAVLLFSLVLIGKLFSLQVINRKAYAESANRQYATPSQNLFERGTIFFKDKNGNLTRAGTQVTGYKIAIAPGKIKDAQDTYKNLSEITKLDQEDFFEKVAKTNDPYEEIATGLTKDVADQVSALSLSGVSVYKEKWRFYPGGSMASHALGFVGYRGDELGGRYGLERSYDNVLSQTGKDLFVNFFAEVFTNIGDALAGKEKSGDVVTTIEPGVQGFLEKTIDEVKKRYSVDQVGGIIMNPKDGSIYAITSKPDFDPNNFSKVKNAVIFSNPWTESVLEFGSVVKPLVMAGGLDSGVITPDTKYNDTGSVVVEKRTIYNFDKKGRGPNTTMRTVLGQSLNTGMVLIYQKLGKEKMREYLYGFGIKEKTNIDLPNETGNLTKNLESPRNIEYANASFGQGIALTPISMARALSALGNGGYLPTPHLVEKIIYEDGTEKKLEYPIKETRISKKTSEEITSMLVYVMDNELSGGKLKFQNHSIALKTGTAQVANPNGGGYYEDRHTHSFFGYFPAYDPEFLVLLYAVHPKGVRYASETWTNPFVDIARFLINYYEVPPDR